MVVGSSQMECVVLMSSGKEEKKKGRKDRKRSHYREMKEGKSRQLTRYLNLTFFLQSQDASIISVRQ